VAYPLLLDETLSGVVAEQLRARGHDVIAVVNDPALIGLPDQDILTAAATWGRALVTANIKDFVPLDQRYKASGRAHGGLVLISAKTFPQDRTFVGAIVAALDKLLNEETIRPDTLLFLQR
jgi:hypothetical protein